MIIEKCPRLNKCTLEISGIDDLIKREYEELKETMLLKIFVILFAIGVGIYNLSYVFITKSVSDDDFKKTLLFTLIPDFAGVVILLIFFIILPRFDIKFQGMVMLALALQLVLQVEFSVSNYDLDEIQYLYFCLNSLSVMNSTFFLGFTNFIFENKLWVIIPVNLLASFYAGLRLTLGIFNNNYSVQ